MTTDPHSVPVLGNKTSASLRKEAKQWLKALRSGDTQALARFLSAYPKPPASAGLRHVQHALARELGFASWTLLNHHINTVSSNSKPTLSPQRTMCEAAGKGDVDGVRAVLDTYPALINERVDLPGSFGKRTALHYGVDHAPVVKLLLQRGANPNIRDDGDNAMPLHFAAEHQDIEVIKLLVKHGADTVGKGTIHELDVLGWAVAWDYIQAKPEVVEYLLGHGARYSIFSAVALGACAEIRRIVAHEPAMLNQPMDAVNHRRRPLHLAVKKKQLEALGVLLELGADTEARDRTNLTPLDQAALANDAEAAQLLLAHGARLELPAAIALGRSADVERLLAEEPGCLQPGGRWESLIVRAAEYAPGHVIETLLKYGASPNAAEAIGKGTTPLHLAAFRGNVDAVRLLLAHGADPARREHEHGSTPLGWAAYAGQEATRRLLLDQLVDIFDAIVMEREGRIVAILDSDPGALERSFGETTGLKNGASYATPLVWAVGHNKPALVRLLLARGARAINAPDGESMLDHALEHGYDEVAELLRGHAAVAPDEQNIWMDAERALLAGDVDALTALLKHNETLFRVGTPPATIPSGPRPDYSARDAKAIIVGNHAFKNWEEHEHFRSQMHIALSTETHFEAAADAIVNGHIEDLRWALHTRPDLVQARSTRKHHATLLQYTTGLDAIEYFRRTVPRNAALIAQLLKDAGATA